MANPRKSIAEVNAGYREAIGKDMPEEDLLAKQVVFEDEVDVVYYKKTEAPRDIATREAFKSPMQTEASRGMWQF